MKNFVEGDEIAAGYTIKNSQFSLTWVIDRYLDLERSKTIPLPQAFILPSRYTDQYIAELNAKVIKMFQSIDLSNGFIFVQCRINKRVFYVLEANYRTSASCEYRLISKINGINYMEMLVNYALRGEMESYDLNLDNPKFHKYDCMFPLASNGGVVGKIIGLEHIKNKKSLISIDQIYQIGDYIEKSGTLGQYFLRSLLIENTIQELKNSIKEIQDTVRVLDDKGNDMLLPPFDTDRI